jgi:uncharacterized protein YkwD
VPDRIRRGSAVLVAAAAAAAPGAAAASLERSDLGGVPLARARGSAGGITDPEAIEPAIAGAINSFRRRHRLRSLAIAAPLARAGDAHARALAVAGLFTHAWPDGRPFVRWIPGYYPHAGHRRWTAGENLLWSAGEITPQSALSLWLASPAHRRLLLSATWHEIGIGVVHAERAAGAYGGQNVYIVAAEFGARS